MYWHLTVSSAGRENLCPRREDRLAMAWTVTRIAAEVLLFCAVDDQLHVVVGGDRPVHLGGALVRILSGRGRAGLAHAKPVAGRRHLITLVEYVLRQPAKHDLAAHPALWEGSCFADLVGARRMGFDVGPLERALPRLHHRDYLTPVGLTARPSPMAWEEVAEVGPSRIAAAVARAAGLDSLRGPRIAQRVRGRQAASWLCHRVGVPTERIAEILDVSPRSAHRLRQLNGEPPLGVAARTWLHLEVLCGRDAQHRAL